jgi:hypothetical protein
MRKISLTIILAGWPALALAQQAGHPTSTTKTPAADRLLPLKGAARGNSCAEYGAGFVRVEGTGTCAKLGGSISVGAGASR